MSWGELLDKLTSSPIMIYTLNVSEIEWSQFMTFHDSTVHWGSLVIGALDRDLNAASDLGSSHYSSCICWCSSRLGKINKWPSYLFRSSCSLVKLSCYSDLSLVTLFLPLRNQFRQRWKALILCLSLILVGGLLFLLIKVLHGQYFLPSILPFALILLKTLKYNFLPSNLLHA